MKKLTIRASDEEYEKLLRFCESAEHTQNDALLKGRVRGFLPIS